MSVTFTIYGERADYEAAVPNYVNFANANAAALLRWLGFEVDFDDMIGVLLPGDLRARCERRLAPTPENLASDLGRAEVVRGNGRFVVECGQAPGRMAERARELLKLAERAGDRAIYYS